MKTAEKGQGFDDTDVGFLAFIFDVGLCGHRVLRSGFHVTEARVIRKGGG
jgi:hypothetical protein